MQTLKLNIPYPFWMQRTDPPVKGARDTDKSLGVWMEVGIIGSYFVREAATHKLGAN